MLVATQKNHRQAGHLWIAVCSIASTYIYLEIGCDYLYGFHVLNDKAQFSFFANNNCYTTKTRIDTVICKFNYIVHTGILKLREITYNKPRTANRMIYITKP